MKKILIVEDDSVVAHIYKTHLEKDGYAVEVAADGQTGYYRIHEFAPDAVLLDLMLPKMNGVGILKKIRAESKFKDMPIMVFTNAYLGNMMAESFGAGATSVFNKATLTPRQILDAFHSALFPPADRSGRGAQAKAEAGPAPASCRPRGGAKAVTESWGNGAFDPAPQARPLVPTYTDPATSPALQAPQPTMAAGAAAATASAVVACAAEVEEDEDAKFQAELLDSFLKAAPDVLGCLRKITQEFGKAQDESIRLSHLMELYRKVHALTGSAGIAGLRNIARMAEALEVLLKDLYEKPKNINPSTRRTIAHSIDFLGELFGRGTAGDLIDETKIKILVADDEFLPRRAITYALEKAGLKSISVEDSEKALNLATETCFDLVFLDVDMPEMDGFDLCKKIRALPANKNTSVIFVTRLSDFTSRARSSLSGGADLIAKPFLFIELSLKALTYALRGQLMRQPNLN